MNQAERLLWVALISALVALGVSVFVVVRRPDPFDPITYQPQRIERVNEDSGQVVVPTVHGFAGIPAIRLDDTVPATGVRCNKADVSVEVTSSLFWERVDVPGTRINVFRFLPGLIDPGCVPLRFENPIPDDVAVRVKDRPQQWRIAGLVTPTDPNGVTEPWLTESFWLVP